MTQVICTVACSYSFITTKDWLFGSLVLVHEVTHIYVYSKGISTCIRKSYIYICDLICEKGSSTNIQITEFEGLYLGTQVR